MTAVSLPAPTSRHVAAIDIDALAAALRAEVRGEVRFDIKTKALYATDVSNYRQVPIGVVIPRDLDDVAVAVSVCQRFGAPLLSRDGGTSLGGQCTNTAVMLDMAKYVNKIESIDTRRRVAVAQAGIVLDELNKAAREKGGLVFGPKPATHDHCTIGGMLGNNSCGATAQWSGTTAANVRRLDVLTYDGRRIWVGAHELPDPGLRTAVEAFRDHYREQIRTGYPQLPRRISGYNLPDLLEENGFNVARALVGSESTCVTILRAELSLLPQPQHVRLVLAGYPDIATAARHVPIANSHQPYVLEGLDHKLIEYEQERRLHTVTIHQIPDAGAWLMAKMTGESDEVAQAAAGRLLTDLRKDGDVTVDKIYDSEEHIAEIDSVREDRARRDGTRARLWRHLARLGRLSRTAGEARRLPARLSPSCWRGTATAPPAST